MEPPSPPPGRRGARPETGGGREAVPRLPRWSGPGTGERRGRGGEGGNPRFPPFFLQFLSEMGVGASRPRRPLAVRGVSAAGEAPGCYEIRPKNETVEAFKPFFVL